MVKVEVFSSPGCGKCAQAKSVLKAVAEDLGQDKDNVARGEHPGGNGLRRRSGVMSSPAIAIDGKLVFGSAQCREAAGGTIRRL